MTYATDHDNCVDATSYRAQVSKLIRERDTARAELAALRERIEALCDEQATWKGYETRDIGHAFLADSVSEFVDDIRAALGAHVADAIINAGWAPSATGEPKPLDIRHGPPLTEDFDREAGAAWPMPATKDEAS